MHDDHFARRPPRPRPGLRPRHPPRPRRRAGPPSSGRGALELLAGAGAGLVLVACGSDGATARPRLDHDRPVAPPRRAAASGSLAGRHPRGDRRPVPRRRLQRANVLIETASSARTSARASAPSGTADGRAADHRPAPSSTPPPAPRCEGAAIYLWHCDREGRYSLYSSGSPTRTTCGACRRPTPTASPLHEHLPRRLRRALAAHPLRGLRDARHGHGRRAPDRHLPARAAGGGLPRRRTPPMATSRA